MLRNLATMPSARAGSGAPEVTTILFRRPAAAALSATYATGGRFQAGMAVSNHNIKVWPLGPQDGSTG